MCGIDEKLKVSAETELNKLIRHARKSASMHKELAVELRVEIESQIKMFINQHLEKTL